MTRYSIAICDDEESVRSIFHDWVSKAKYDADVKEYSGGDELIKDIDAGAGIDILFLDIAMGKNDGIETAKELGRRIEASGK
ncbi:MAG: response regulator, partial [Butyrivibrio sp.]|nr:response regulator [Butyrivibrio sp.]